ncbi:MAG: hypothetical protein HC828_13130 [Blastochloris sp.]|nr:hypothetical protein [Blastochloris sp.]
MRTKATARCCGSRRSAPPSRFPSRRREERKEQGAGPTIAKDEDER